MTESRISTKLEGWINLGGVVASEVVHLSWHQRADTEISREAGHAPRVGEDHIESEVLLAATLPGPREPSKNEIEKHNNTIFFTTLLCRGATSVSERKAVRFPQYCDIVASSCNSIRLRCCWNTSGKTKCSFAGWSWHEHMVILGMSSSDQLDCTGSLLVVRQTTRLEYRSWREVSTCLIKLQFYSLERQRRAEDQEHSSTS